MGGLKACRVCLATDVKMYDMQEYQLESQYEPIVGVNPLCVVELPSYACYQCATLIQKYNLFRLKCLTGQSMFYDILQKYGKITINEIKQINRHKLNLTSNLAQCIIPGDIVIKHDHGEDYDFEDTQEEKKQEYVEFNSETLLDIKSIKEEVDEYPEMESPCIPSCDEDDEPLSLHKSLKEKKIKKSGKKRKKETTMAEELDINLYDDTSTLLEERPTEVKRARGRPKKTPLDAEQSTKTTKTKQRRTKNTGGVAHDEGDIEDYAEIVTLSMEDQMREINTRQQSSNYMNAPYKCNLCFKGFIDTKAWKHHVSKHSPSAGDVECPVCKFRFKTKRAYQKHATNHEKKYHCKACSYVSRTTTQAKQHQKWHKGVTYKCQYCDEISTKWTSYLSHVRMKHPSEFICGICGYSFVSKLGLNMHKTMMHKDVVETQDNENKGPYCSECDVQFISEESWKRHMVTSVKHMEKNQTSHGCRVCGESFKTAEDLRLHHRKQHARKRPKNYGKKPAGMEFPAKCEHCEEQIPNARDYWTHFRRVHPDKIYPIQKSYICEICGKSFRGNAFLVYHKRTHSSERAYQCGACPKAFYNRTNLQMHERTHSDLRPYPCTVCFKAFKGKGALDRHFRSHTGVKPYSCSFCGKSFGQSNSCKLHVHTVHLKQPAPYVSRSRLQHRRNTGKAPPETLQNYTVKKTTEMFQVDN